MVRFAYFVAVLVTLGVTAGAPVSPFNAAIENDEHGMHERRTSSYYKKVYCDSYDCPYGFILIDDADEEKCKWGKCKKSQCCDKVCSSFDCPKYYYLVDDADTTVCEWDKCTKDQCCYKYH